MQSKIWREINLLFHCEFWIIQKLIEWHFNLMDEGEEFVDVNTLEENPYKKKLPNTRHLGF